MPGSEHICARHPMRLLRAVSRGQETVAEAPEAAGDQGSPMSPAGSLDAPSTTRITSADFLAGSRGADLGNLHRARPGWAWQRDSACRKLLRPRVRAARGNDDVGEGLAALNGDGPRVDRREFGPLDGVSLGTTERDASMATITGGANRSLRDRTGVRPAWIACSPRPTAHAEVRTMADGIATRAGLLSSAPYQVSFV